MHKIILASSLTIGLATAGVVHAQTTPQVPYTARAFSPAHADLARSAGVPARLANEAYVEALARVVYYWAYPAVDIFGRTSMWETMKDGPGMLLGTAPDGPVNTSSCIADYLPPAQRIVVTPNNDTFYGATFVDLGREPVVVQTPTEVLPKGTTGPSRSPTSSPTSSISSARRRRRQPASFCSSARTGQARSRMALSISCAYGPTMEEPSSAASRRAHRKARRERLLYSTRWACIR